MNFFQKLERKYSRYAIHNLMYYIIILYLVGFGLNLIAPWFYWMYLSLDPAMILRGQVWRVVTFIIYPPTTSLIFAVFVFLLYYSVGRSLEQVWGAFRFNVYFFMGMLFHVIAAMVLYLVFDYKFGWYNCLTTTYLNASVFFAYAVTFPEEWFYIYFIFAVRAKWLAIVEGAFFAAAFVIGGATTRLEILLALANFLIYFAVTRSSRMSPKEIKRKRDFKAQIRPVSRTRHVCAVCGRTDQDSPGMEFRYCSKCEGDYEYCMDHLYTHQHVKKSKVVSMAGDEKKTSN